MITDILADYTDVLPPEQSHIAEIVLDTINILIDPEEDPESPDV